MGAQPFNHLAAVAAAKERAANLRARARMLWLAKLTATANRGDLIKERQELQIRQRGLEQFIDDPYPPNSLFHIGFERDRRAILEAGMPLQGRPSLTCDGNDAGHRLGNEASDLSSEVRRRRWWDGAAHTKVESTPDCTRRCR